MCKCSAHSPRWPCISPSWWMLLFSHMQLIICRIARWPGRLPSLRHGFPSGGGFSPRGWRDRRIIISVFVQWFKGYWCTVPLNIQHPPTIMILIPTSLGPGVEPLGGEGSAELGSSLGPLTGLCSAHGILKRQLCRFKPFGTISLCVSLEIALESHSNPLASWRSRCL